jgi:hypothetical protein
MKARAKTLESFNNTPRLKIEFNSVYCYDNNYDSNISKSRYVFDSIVELPERRRHVGNNYYMLNSN